MQVSHAAQELILFSRADLERSIPSMLDGLKPGQRKILFGCFKRNLTKDIKVLLIILLWRQFEAACILDCLPAACPVSCTDSNHGRCSCCPMLQLHTQRHVCVSTVRPSVIGTACYGTGEPAGWLRIRALSIPPWRCESDLHHCGHGAVLCGQQQCEPVVSIRSTSVLSDACLPSPMLPPPPLVQTFWHTAGAA